MISRESESIVATALDALLAVLKMSSDTKMRPVDPGNPSEPVARPEGDNYLITDTELVSGSCIHDLDSLG